MTEEEMKERIAALENDNEKLKADKHAALGEKNKANAAAKAAQEAADAAADEAAEKAGDIEAIKASLTKKYEAQIAKLTDGNTALNKQLNTLLIDNTITAEIAKLNVPAHAQRALALQLKDGAEVRDGAALVGDMPLSDHIATYFSSDEGKAWLPAPANGGGAAPGSSAVASNHGFTRENINTPSKQAEWMALEISNPTLFKQVAADTGMKGFE